MSKKHLGLIFDLDGTLADSEGGILRSMQHAIKELDLPKRTNEELRVHVGAPLREIFKLEFGLSTEKATEAVKVYRAYYVPNEAERHPPFDGIVGLLHDLKKAGKRLGIATSKPTQMAEKILKAFGVYDLFDVVHGSNMDDTRAKKVDILKAAMEDMTEKAGLDKADMLMIGDKHFDVEAAHALDVDVMGVLYGCGTKVEMDACHPTYTAKTVEDLRMFLLQEY
ncbi:MAG: HAD hydrolase-like protein [Eubacteriales bacterium]